MWQRKMSAIWKFGLQPTCSINDHMTYRDVMEATLDGLEEARKECGTYYNVIVCCMRHFDLETNLSMLKGCREFLGAGVCAADLAGDETSWAHEPVQGIVPRGEEAGLSVYHSCRRMWQRSEYHRCSGCRSTRVGHGIAMKGFQEVQKLCRDHHIGVEICPTSNLQTRAVSTLKEYPIREFLDNGVMVTVNTDNRTVSGTNLIQELSSLENAGVIAEPEMILLMEHALEAAFADDAVKQELYKMLKSYSL